MKVTRSLTAIGEDRESPPLAEQADVAVQTVYAVFGTKRAILTELLDVRIVGDDQSTTLRDRVD